MDSNKLCWRKCHGPQGLIQATQGSQRPQCLHHLLRSSWFSLDTPASSKDSAACWSCCSARHHGLTQGSQRWSGDAILGPQEEVLMQETLEDESVLLITVAGQHRLF